MSELSPAVWTAYVAAGLLMPLFYVSQIAVCIRDRAGLPSYSMSKAAIHVACRVLMFPYIVLTGSPTMTFIVALDLVGRIIELGAAVFSLYRAGWAWVDIGARVIRLDFKGVAKPSVDEGPLPQAASETASDECADQSKPLFQSAGLAPLCTSEEYSTQSCETPPERAI